jgi:predicted nucleotide-binding protein (sugar kinase/HSP70/actin superfamily)
VGGNTYLNPGVYDSHVGRLFADKGVAVLPSWIFDIELDDEFKDIYWRNPHHILSVASGIAKRSLSLLIKDKRLKEAMVKFEASAQPLGLVVVSTFRCGPDSVVLPAIQEVAKDMPLLVIQSDAAINELAHLENRVNTFLSQMKSGSRFGQAVFCLEDLNIFSSSAIDKENDVIYFPTLEDNRMLSAVLRSAGYNCPDNYGEDYNLGGLVGYGRRFSGDAVCAPLAAVLADTLLAVEDYVKRLVAGEMPRKRRVLVFNNKGEGPCRQGQYYNAHRLYLKKEAEKQVSRLAEKFGVDLAGLEVCYIVGREENGYNIGLEWWVWLQALQATVMQGVVHSLYFKGSQIFSDVGQLAAYRQDCLVLRNDLAAILENFRPAPRWLSLVSKHENNPVVLAAASYFGCRLYNNSGLRARLRQFKKKYPAAGTTSINIYCEGEAYMRVAQAPALFDLLVDLLGPGRFRFDYSPLWLYLEYLTKVQTMNTQEKASRGELSVSAATKKIRKLGWASRGLRGLLAKPLYRAAGLDLPEAMDTVLGRSRRILPKLKPQGELAPYIGEALGKLDKGCDLFLNIAPEGCMVSAMGEMLTDAIRQQATAAKPSARIQSLFSADGELDEERLQMALLKTLSPEVYYQKR